MFFFARLLCGDNESLVESSPVRTSVFRVLFSIDNTKLEVKLIKVVVMGYRLFDSKFELELN